MENSPIMINAERDRQRAAQQEAECRQLWCTVYAKTLPVPSSWAEGADKSLVAGAEMASHAADYAVGQYKLRLAKSPTCFLPTGSQA